MSKTYLGALATRLPSTCGQRALVLNALPSFSPRTLPTVRYLSTGDNHAHGINESKLLSSNLLTSLVQRETIDPTDYYLAVRGNRPWDLSDFPQTSFNEIVIQAFRQRNNFILDAVASDMLACDTIPLETRLLVVQALLECELKRYGLKKTRLLQLIKFYMSNSELLNVIPESILSMLARIVLNQEGGPTEEHVPLLDNLVPSLLVSQPRKSSLYIRQDLGGGGLTSEPFYHRPHTWLLFQYLLFLLEKQDLRSAVGLFNSLVRAERVSPGSLQTERADGGMQGAQRMIIGTVVRSCLFWGWRGRTVFILRSLFSESSSVLPNIYASSPEGKTEAARFISDTLLQLLDDAVSAEDVALCANLLCSIASNTRFHPISSLIIGRFYTAAYSVNAPDLAGQVYKTLHQSGKEREHNYPPPADQALFWLLSWFVTVQHDMHAARTLAHQVFDGGHDVVISELPRFIRLLARRGFMTAARGLWMRYTEADSLDPPNTMVERNRAILYGSSMVMPSLVRLSVRMAYKAESAEQNDEGEVQELDYDSDRTEIVDDYKAFARLVLSKFIEAKQPLKKAGRSDINAITNAYFALGEIDKALETMRLLINRKEIPTPRDLGVVLAGMATFSPRRAAKMMQLMLDKGIPPLVSDFGAIIHEASIRGDKELVGALVTKARAVGHEQLTMEGLHSMIRFSVRFKLAKKNERPVEEAETLRRVLQLIKALIHEDHVPTPWMGARCITACVRVNQGRLAHEFWRLLVKEKENWEHRSQVELRNTIKTALRRDIERGWVARRDGEKMIRELTTRK